MEKEIDPMKLETGKEIYEYLKDKSKEEVDDFFVLHGAKRINGHVYCFNESGILNARYQIEKEHREKKDNGKRWNANDGEFDGVER